MSTVTYFPNGMEHLWADELLNGRSILIVGERGSGLSSAVEHVLLSSAELSRRAVHVSARVLMGVNSFLTGIAGECVDIVVDSECRQEIEADLRRLQERFDYLLMASLLKRVIVAKFVPLVIIDRFDALAPVLDETDWASFRYLIERRLLQVIILSRLSIGEIETLSHSVLAQTISQEVLRPLDSPDELGRFLKGTLDPAGAIERSAIDHIFELGAGHRLLTKKIAELSLELSRSEGCKVDVGLVNEAIALNRSEILKVLRTWVFRSMSPLQDGQSAVDLEGELAFAHEVNGLPNHLVDLRSPYCDRLVRLGHLKRRQNGSVGPIDSHLLRSYLSLQRNEYFRRADGETKDWLRLERALRSKLRSRCLDIENQGWRSLDGVRALWESWELYCLWWGELVECDFFEFLFADALLLLATRVGIFNQNGLIKNQASLDLLYSVRRSHDERVISSQARRAIGAAVKLIAGELDPQGSIQCDLHDAEGADGDQRIVRWLHISDLHLKAPGVRAYGEETVRRAFLDALVELMSDRVRAKLGPAPDVVFFTGDIAFSGQKNEYREALSFFRILMDVLRLPMSRLFIIPGNHDVDRGALLYLSRCPKSPEDTYWSLRDERWRRLYGERLANFEEFCGALFADDPERLYRTEIGFLAPIELEIRGLSVAIHRFNSQWCGGLDDDQGKLVMGSSLISNDLNEKYRHLSKCDLSVGLSHQPLEFLAEHEQQEFMSGLAGELDVLLCGHLHLNDVSKVVDARNELRLFRAGALFAGMNHPNSAQIVEVQVDSREFAIYPMRFEQTRARWERDTSIGELPDYVFRSSLSRNTRVVQNLTRG